MLTDNTEQTWPPIVWFAMKISGIFYHQQIVRQRRCLSCDMEHFAKQQKIKSDDTNALRPIDVDITYNLTSQYESNFSYKSARELGNDKRSQDDDTCDACKTCWWNKDGNVVRYTESSIGVSHWNHPGSWLLSIIILFTTIGLLINEFRRTINTKFGNPKKLLHLLSYTAFLCKVSIVPIMSLSSKLRSAFSGRGPGSWATAINARFIVRRLQFLDPAKNGYPGKIFLVACLVWPVLCAVFRCYVILGLSNKQTTEDALSCIIAGLAQFIWGCFVFLIYLMRRSFQIQLDLVLRFLKTMEGQTELCQRVLRQVTEDFRCFRHCVRIYMTAVIPLCVLGITTNLTWQYMLHATDAKPSESLNTQKYINIMIWLEISMFICLGAVAVGGIDAKHIWEMFQLSIYCLQSSHQRSHWNYLIRYLKHVEERTPAVSFSMILSVVGFYMAVQFGKQDVIY
ncbi:uncharacterized protein [Apostichopus japonicus]|uniref:uncharacterized protein n=1 Tax=Stichopus japonicus TaxID=307972 RepID=UPI003AB4EEF8